MNLRCTTIFVVAMLCIPLSAIGVTTNLLTNPGAEAGNISSWTPGGGATPGVDSGSFDPGINPHSGNYDFYGVTSAEDTLTQNVTLLGNQGINALMIDSGSLQANVDFFAQGLNQGTQSDSAHIVLTYHDATTAVIGTSSTPEIDSHNSVWTEFSASYQIPAGTRSIDYTMDFVRHVGSDNDSFLDDNSLTIGSVPEPDTSLLCAIGLVAILSTRKQREFETGRNSKRDGSALNGNSKRDGSALNELN